MKTNHISQEPRKIRLRPVMHPNWASSDHVINCIAFGKQLILTEDLDPIYTMLYSASLSDKTLKRFLLAYWCFYHAGVSARIAEAKDYWAEMFLAQTEKWPRGTERRHFRGAQSEQAIKALQATGKSPEAIVEKVTQPSTFSGIINASSQLRGFGSWMSFKVADMAERLLKPGAVSLDGFTLKYYRDPMQGAALLRYGSMQAYISEDGLQEVTTLLENKFSSFKTPPGYDRPINMQEVETVLCKYKSHCNGHYPMGKDTKEVLHGLTGWGKLADHLKQALSSRSKSHAH